MFPKCISIFLATILIISGCANAKIPFSSIQHFGDVHQIDGQVHEFCTAWATKIDNETRWVTAAHCLFTNDEDRGEHPPAFVVNSKSVEVIKVDPLMDLALLSGGPTAAPLTIALGEAKLGDKVRSFSFFFSPSGSYVEGLMSSLAKGKAVFQMSSGPGASGGPITTPDNIVVGINAFVPCPYVCSMVAGSSVTELRQFLFNEPTK